MKSSNTPPTPPVPPSRSSRRANDFLLEPLPVPDSVESDSDTAWGLWEATLKGEAGTHDGSTQPIDLHDSGAGDLPEPDPGPDTQPPNTGR